MKPKIRIHSEALKEISEAFERYREESVDLAESFLNQLALSFNKIAANPQLYPVHTRNTRRRLVDRFPYAVIFLKKEDVIQIIAVAHTKRRPGYWTERI